ncbi:hypothetical protein B0G81_8095 [Paraburkholderia sp. BL6665CI2N2]|nr:hypothetical protein B0G81_8095 [Paraburkholderia sp. BL6665CI2N2]
MPAPFADIRSCPELEIRRQNRSARAGPGRTTWSRCKASICVVDLIARQRSPRSCSQIGSPGRKPTSSLAVTLLSAHPIWADSGALILLLHPVAKLMRRICRSRLKKAEPRDCERSYLGSRFNYVQSRLRARVTQRSLTAFDVERFLESIASEAVGQVTSMKISFLMCDVRSLRSLFYRRCLAGGNRAFRRP